MEKESLAIKKANEKINNREGKVKTKGRQWISVEPAMGGSRNFKFNWAVRHFGVFLNSEI